MITPEQLQEWRRLCDAATPGEWHVQTAAVPAGGERWGAVVARRHPAGGAGSYPRGMTTTWKGDDGYANAAFIAAARTAMPSLLDAHDADRREIVRLQARVEVLEDAINYYRRAAEDGDF